VGVHETLYSLDNGQTFNVYTDPFIVSSEGFNTVIYQSVDKLGNPEPEQSLSINIDKTPPEAEVFFDPQSLQQSITGIDNQSQVQVTQINELVFLLTDEAGHTLEVAFSEFEELDYGASSSLQHLVYNGSLAELHENRFRSTFKTYPDIGLVTIKQNLTVAGQFLVRTDFGSTDLNQTVVLIKYPEQPVEEQTFHGLYVIILKTSQGELDFEMIVESSLP
jgi:hypothetical protein